MRNSVFPTLAAAALFLSTPASATLPPDYQGTPFTDLVHKTGPTLIPGILHAALYDLGGEGIAYHDTDATNNGSGKLNLEPGHQRAHAGPYIWHFRKDEGVDLSFVKDWADLNHTNLVTPHLNQFYIGWTEDGEWCNYTVHVTRPGTYRIKCLYAFQTNTVRFDLNHQPAATCRLPIPTSSYHHWNYADIGSIHFPEPGPQLLTFHYGKGNNFASFTFEPAEPAPIQTARNVAFLEDFDSPNPLSRWKSPPSGASLERVSTGNALTVQRLPTDGAGTTLLSTALPADALRGCRVRLEARLRATNVAKPPNPWNGIKVMLHSHSPTTGDRWDQQNDLFGTFDWLTSRRTFSLPDDLDRAELVLGLEDTTGQVSFDDVQITVLRQPQSITSSQPAGPAFKGHNLPRLRGAMVQPDITPDSLRVLGSSWHANLIRWQLIRYVNPGSEISLDTYDAWLDSELAKLDRLLPLCSQLGIRVALDLHSPPGGARTASGYIGSDTGLFTNALAQAHFIRVWQRMAQRYQTNTAIWGFDIANEPVEEELGEGCDDWQTLATRTAQAIRAIDPTHAIIVEPSPWGSPGSIRNLDPIPVPGIVYSVHMYEPSRFTHQGIHGNPGDIHYPGPINKIYHDKNSLRTYLQPVIDFQKAHNAHIYLGEFSAIRWAPGAVDYLRDVISLFEEHDWDWSYHAFREYHGWSVEHGPDPQNTQPSPTPTDRQQLLLDWFSRNRTSQ